MQTFWLATWPLAQRQPATHNPWEPIACDGATALAVEVLQDGARLVVLVSSADDADDPQVLQCRLAFSNDAAGCNAWRSRGFPVLEATFLREDGKLQVLCSFFDQAHAMVYDRPLLTIDGVPGEPRRSESALVAHYQQVLDAPDPLDPATMLKTTDALWNLQRQGVRELTPAPATLEIPDARSPALLPLASGSLPLRRAWTGTVSAPEPGKLAKPQAPTRRPRGTSFGDAAFRFSDMEVLGFRLDLGDTRATRLAFAQWVRSLNFDSRPGDLLPTFQVVTPVILVELLRYGRMQPADAQPPFDEQDFQCQHELVVRLQVGLTTDEGAPARAPAVHVPAIFVDNPWSKMLGRELQGFDKRMAAFRAKDDVLRPDGRLPGHDERVPLWDVTSIDLVDVIGSGRQGGAPLLELGVPGQEERPFRRLGPTEMAFDADPARPRWRSTDFDRDKLVSGFAREAASLDHFDSVQVSPVDGRPLDAALIYARCDVHDLEVSTPTDMVQLAFHLRDGAPDAWNLLARLLGAAPDAPAECTIAHLDWYRLKFSMDLTGQDAFPVEAISRLR